VKMLAFDTCLDKTYVTLFDGESFKNKIITSTGENYHSAYLISTIVEILKSSNMTPSDLECIATDTGPGSFTGIRACTTVARMLSQQLNIKAVGVSSLEVLSKISGGNNMVALDARKNKAYLYDGKILGAIELENVEEMVKGRRLVTDNRLYAGLSAFAKETVSYEQNEYPLGQILAETALNKLSVGETCEWSSLKPLYIQPPPVFGK